MFLCRLVSCLLAVHQQRRLFLWVGIMMYYYLRCLSFCESRHLQVTGKKKSPLGKLTSEKIPTPIVFLDFFLARVPNSGCGCKVWVYSNRKGDSIFIYSPRWQPPAWVGAQDFWSQPWRLSFLDVGVQKVPVSLPEWGLCAAASPNNRSRASS